MGLTDKFDNAKDEATGKAKEATGKATDDESLEAEGRADQAQADLKQAGEKVKDALGHWAPAWNTLSAEPRQWGRTGARGPACARGCGPVTLEVAGPRRWRPGALLRGSRQRLAAR